MSKDKRRHRVCGWCANQKGFYWAPDLFMCICKATEELMDPDTPGCEYFKWEDENDQEHQE